VPDLMPARLDRGAGGGGPRLQRRWLLSQRHGYRFERMAHHLSGYASSPRPHDSRRSWRVIAHATWSRFV